MDAALEQAKHVDQSTLQNWLEKLDDAYHNGVSNVPDCIYDEMIRIYTKRFGAYTKVGALPSTDREKVRLPYEAPGLDKLIYRKEEASEIEKQLTRYCSRIAGPYILQDKIDGLTGIYAKGRLYTRGDTKVGMDISFLLEYLSLPLSPWDVRGEIVMTRAAFQRFKQEVDPDASTARNSASGIANRKASNIDVTAVRFLSFVAYQILNAPEGMDGKKQLQVLQEVGFMTPQMMEMETLEVDVLVPYLQQRKKEALYDMDGIVIYPCHYYPLCNSAHLLAFKLEPPSSLTRVVNIEWEVSKDRLLKPIVVYEPFQFEGSTLMRANGKNAKNIREHKIGRGALIRVTRQGDAIPEILEVLEGSSDIPWPDKEYEWNRTEVEIVLCEENDEVKAKRLDYFFTTLDIKYLGPAILKKLVKAGYETIHSVLSMQEKEWIELERMGPASAKRIRIAIEKGITQVPLSRVMAASGVFGRGFSEKRAELLLSHYPQLLDHELSEVEISAIEGFGPIFAKQITERLPIFREWIVQHPMIQYVLPTAKVAIPKSGKLSQRIIVVSGFRGDAAFQARIGAQGGIYSENDMRKKDAERTLLVVSATPGTAKVEKARKYKIPILAREQFENEYLT